MRKVCSAACEVQGFVEHVQIRKVRVLCGRSLDDEIILE